MKAASTVHSPVQNLQSSDLLISFERINNNLLFNPTAVPVCVIAECMNVAN